ncbi:MAG: hydroxyacid dehydrogenase [Firmicutes bacterium]|nr:hydroxyacid dehydrogenase [Bacillota bacterium]
MAAILVTEFLDPAGLEILSQAGEVHYDPDLWRDAAALRARVQEADALVVRNQTRVTRALLEETPIRVVGRLGVGLDNVDVRAAEALNVTVVVARGANATAVAEYVLAACFHFSRRLAWVGETTQAGQWDRTLGGTELQGKWLGIVGLGDIGQRLALRARALGMRVAAHDPAVLTTHWAVLDCDVALMPLDELLASADFVSLHVPLTPETRHLLNRDRLRLMKPTAYLINTARGGIVDEAALAQALRENRIAGCALDVREEEPPASPDPLASDERVLLTPHIAGLTAEARQRTSLLVAEDVVRVLTGQEPRAAVVKAKEGRV